MKPGPLRRLARVAPAPRGRPTLAVLAGVATLACSVGLMTTSGWLLARASQRPRVAELAIAIVAVRAFGTARGFLRYLERLIAHDAALRRTAELRAALVERLAVLAPGAVEPDRAGDLLHRVASDVEAIEVLHLRSVHPLAVAAVTSAGAVVVGTMLLPKAGAVLAVALVLGGVVVPAVAAAAARTAGARLARARASLASEVVDLVAGAPELVAWGGAEHQLAALDDAERVTARLERREAHVTGVGAALGRGVAGLAVPAVLLVSIPAATGGRLDVVAVAALAFLALAAFEAVADLPAAFARLAELRAAAGRVLDVLDRPEPTHEPLFVRAVPPGPHTLVVDGARLRYTADGPWVLDGVDLRLEPGRSVAITGISGAGKTTLAKALVRFRDLDGGRILLDGVDVTELASDDVRRVVGLVEQSPYLFHTSIRENLLLARPDATDADLDDAARAAGLLSWIESLPDGWSTDVGEAGGQVSGGERRRIGLARALLAGFPVLILDEPTADVDQETAAAITAAVLTTARREHRSVVLITHDTDGLADVDEVLTLEGGTLHPDKPAAVGVHYRQQLPQV